LFLGTQVQAASPFVLNSLHITHIVDATGHDSNPWKEAFVGQVGQSLLHQDAVLVNSTRELARQIVHGGSKVILPKQSSQSQSLLDTFKYETEERPVRFLCLKGLRDQVDADIQSHFDAVNDFIDKAIQQSGCVFVHCQAGVSRSPTLVIAYLMSRHSMTLDQAYSFVQHRRPLIKPNDGFLRQLIQYYQDALHNDSAGSEMVRARLVKPIILL
jgi:protein-tyrosine phosphatase